jgi:hypothetical protein
MTQDLGEDPMKAVVVLKLDHLVNLVTGKDWKPAQK